MFRCDLLLLMLAFCAGVFIGYQVGPPFSRPSPSVAESLPMLETPTRVFFAGDEVRINGTGTGYDGRMGTILECGTMPVGCYLVRVTGKYLILCSYVLTPIPDQLKEAR